MNKVQNEGVETLQRSKENFPHFKMPEFPLSAISISWGILKISCAQILPKKVSFVDQACNIKKLRLLRYYFRYYY